MAFKLSGTLPEQVVDIKLPSYKKDDICNGSRTDYRGSFGNAEAHVVEYGDGSRDVYVNFD